MRSSDRRVTTPEIPRIRIRNDRRKFQRADVFLEGFGTWGGKQSPCGKRRHDGDREEATCPECPPRRRCLCSLSRHQLIEPVTKRLQVAMEISCRRVPLSRVFCQTALDNPAKRHRHACIQHGRVRRLVIDDGIERRRGRVPPEGRPTACHLEQDQTERELIGTIVACRSTRLFRAHVWHGTGA
jgi:hypothetical protein